MFLPIYYAKPTCIINGCECPAGTVIDEDKGECVAPSECEGTHIGMFWLC